MQERLEISSETTISNNRTMSIMRSLLLAQLLSMLVSTPLCFGASSNPIIGEYETLDGKHVLKISQNRDSSHISAVWYHGIENVRPCSADGIKVCVPISGLTLLIPSLIQVGTKIQFEHMSSEVLEHHVSIALGKRMCQDIFLILTQHEMNAEGFPSAIRSYFLLWSKQEGLVAFTESPDTGNWIVRDNACIPK